MDDEGLRQRHVAGTDSATSESEQVLEPASGAQDASEGVKATERGSSAGEQHAEQLRVAREALAARVQAQQDADGWTLVNESDARSASPPEAHSPTRAQASVADVAAPASEHEAEGDEEANEALEELQVAEMLQGRRSPGASCAGAKVDEPEDARLCRICFDGEDPDLGRLISPCKCRGTSRFVHSSCLNRWRTSSTSQSAFYKCQQCGYEYKLQRTAIAGLADNRFALASLTAILLFFLVFLAGFLATALIDLVEERSMYLTEAGTSWFEDVFVSEHILIGEAVKDAVDFFGNNERLARTTGSEMFIQAARPTFLRRSINHILKGVALVGILSFSQLVLAASFLNPFGFRGGFLRMFRPARNRRGGLADAGGSISQLVIVVTVLLGLWRALTQVYKLVRWIAHQSLQRMETAVLEV